VRALGAGLIVLDSVVVEADHLLRRRIGPHAGRAFLSALAGGTHSLAFLSAGLFGRATEIDARYADLNLGITDATLMAYAERHDLPILTFDFEHFRATAPAEGHWRLVIDEAAYANAVGT